MASHPMPVAALSSRLPRAQRIEAVFRIGGMHCAACSGIISELLMRLPGVESAQVNAASERASVRWNPQRIEAATLVDAIEAAGYLADPDTAAHAGAMRKIESRAAIWRLFVAVFCAMQIMMLATPAYVSAAGDLAADQKRLLDLAAWMLTLPILAFSARPFFSGAWQSLRQRRIGMEVPVALGITCAFVASTIVTFMPDGIAGGDVYFDSLSMFVSFLLAGRLLEMQMRHKAERLLEEATERVPAAVMRLTVAGGSELVNPSRLRRGDRVRVLVGDGFPADGTLIDGTCEADESLITGESCGVAKAIGDAVIAGSRNLRGPVVMRVERVGADTRYEAICGLMRAVRNGKPQLLAAVDRWAGPFVGCVLGLAAASGFAWSLIDPSRMVWVVISVLIVTCPCALSLAAPSALLSAAAAMGRHGLLLRRIDAIEGLARVDTLFLDKTGTLTECGKQGVSIEPVDPHDRSWIEGFAASLASASAHPLSRAIVACHRPSPVAWTDLREVAGSGVEGLDSAGYRWRLGASNQEDSGRSVAAQAWLTRDGLATARFSFDEVLRADVVEAVRALKADGIRVRLLSGDDPIRVARIATMLDIAGDGGMTPDDKLRVLRDAQAHGEIVAMIGDGINDGPVLAQADVSLAMAEGATLARAEADGVLLFNRLGDVVVARTLAKKAVRIVHQNFAWAITYNLVSIPLAIGGWMPPWVAGAGMACSSLVVVANGLRLTRR